MTEWMVNLLKTPKVEVNLEQNDGIYWVRGWIYYPVPEADGEKVVSSWSFHVEGEIELLCEEELFEETDGGWSVRRTFLPLYSSEGLFIGGDEGRKNYKQLVDYLTEKFRARLETEVRNALTSEFWISNEDIVKLDLHDVKISLRIWGNSPPAFWFRTTIYMDLRLPVRLFYEKFSPNKDVTDSELSFLIDVVYDALPDELKDSVSVTRLLTEIFRVVKLEYRFTPQESWVQPVWEVKFVGSTGQRRAGLSTLDFEIPLPEEIAKTLLEHRGNPEGILETLIAYLVFFPEGEISIGKSNYYVEVHENDISGLSRIDVSPSELVNALRMFINYGLRGKD